MINILKAVRIVIINEKRELAVIKVSGGLYYKVPGGFINPKEGKHNAAHRKAKEEGASEIEIICKLGDYEFIAPKDDGRVFRSNFYLAKKIITKKGPNFEDWQSSKRFELMWVDFDEAVKMFESAKTEDVFEKNVNKRDFLFLKKGWRKYLEISMKGKKVNNIEQKI